MYICPSAHSTTQRHGRTAALHGGPTAFGNTHNIVTARGTDGGRDVRTYLHHPVRDVALALLCAELHHPGVRLVVPVGELEEHRELDVAPRELVQRRGGEDDLVPRLEVRLVDHGDAEALVLRVEGRGLAAALLAAHHGDAPEEGETELRVIALAAAPGAESEAELWGPGGEAQGLRKSRRRERCWSEEQWQWKVAVGVRVWHGQRWELGFD